MTPIAADARLILEAVLLRLAEPGCSCDGGKVCQACAAIEALERLARNDFVAGMLGAEQEKATAGQCDN